VVISGIGGLGHVAVQYAKAMDLHVAAMTRRRGTVSLVGLPPGGFPTPIFV